ncbi:MAG: WD40 repeat domain-containing protein [Methanoregula sp.]|nr:WD40 repeat domain-containing protein [Methanoregula sp.]
MPTGFRVFLAITALLMISCMAGVVTAASIGNEWKERIPFEGSSYNGLVFSADGSKIFAGGSQMYLRSWDGKEHWGGRPGFVTAMSSDGNYVVYGQGNSLVVLFRDGGENWTRNMDGDVRAVAVSGDGKYVVAADNKGNINTWTIDGEFYARNTTDLIKQIAISPSDTLVVATTETGLKFFTPALSPVWSDTKNGSIDTDIFFSGDGSTIITSGGKRVSSHTNTGRLNWMNDVSKSAILGTACSYDCSVIVISSQDGNIQALDRYGTVHWTYPVGPWINSVAVSRDARAIVGAGIDRNLYVLSNAGKLLAKKQMDTIIHPRSIAMSRDGQRIVVADENNLNGLILSLDSDKPELVTLIPRTTAQYTGTPTPAPTAETTVPATPVISMPVTAVPVTTTPKSPLDPVTALVALGAGLSLVQGVRKH